jgi:hypothetical protein
MPLACSWFGCTGWFLRLVFTGLVRYRITLRLLRLPHTFTFVVPSPAAYIRTAVPDTPYGVAAHLFATLPPPLPHDAVWTDVAGLGGLLFLWTLVVPAG